MAKKTAGKKQKSPYDLIDEDFKTRMLQEKDDGKLQSELASITLNQAAMLDAKKADPDLQRIREELKTANEPYAAASKANKQKVAFIREVLRGRGRSAGEYDNGDETAE